MKYLITEQQYSRFIKGSPLMQNIISEYLTYNIEKGKRKIGKKSRNYGNFREDWCIGGKESIHAIYHFDDDKPTGGTLLISETIIETIMSLFGVKRTFILHTIEEWYGDTMIPQFEEIVGEKGLFINEIDTLDGEYDCFPVSEKPEGITDEEMIDFIENNTFNDRQEIINQIESGRRDLEDIYLDIVDIVNRRHH
jgi:hypothetical protein